MENRNPAAFEAAEMPAAKMPAAEMPEAKTALAAQGMQVFENEPLCAHTTFRIGGCAALSVFPKSADALLCAVRTFKNLSLPMLILGCGSNVLAPDEGFSGGVIYTTEMKEISCDAQRLTADAGVSLTRLSCFARDHALAGLAFAYGIPGSLGGGIFMNAGAYGGELSQVVESVRCYDAEKDVVMTLSNTDCGFDYRTSVFQKKNRVILSATLALRAGKTEEIRAEMEDYMSRRREKQPLDYPSAGSAFKRYPGFYTAQLIDEAGLKGASVGGAQVSEKHAGFIINRGGATAADVKALITKIQEEIYQKNGIKIEPEIRIL